jgi:hypothetical protein
MVARFARRNACLVCSFFAVRLTSFGLMSAAIGGAVRGLLRLH